MTKQEQLIDYYKAVLATMGVQPAGDGSLVRQGSSPWNLSVEDRRVVLPTPEVLSRLNSDNSIAAFHPLSENIFGGHSPMLSQLRYVAMSKLNELITITGYVLLDIACDKNLHVQLSETQLKTVSALGDVDDKLRDNFAKLVNNVKVLGPNQVVNVFLKHKGELDGVKYIRTALISFPLLEALEKTEDGHVYGVKFRKKDIPVLKAMLKAIIEKVDVPNAYSAGSNSKNAPYFFSLVKAYANLMKELSGISWIFRSFISDMMDDSYTHVTQGDLDFISNDDTIEKIAGMTSCIPALPFNTGDTAETPVAQTTKPQPSFSSQPAPYTAPQQQQSQPTPQQQEPVGYQPPQQQPAPQQPTGYQPPVQQPQVAPQNQVPATFDWLRGGGSNTQQPPQMPQQQWGGYPQQVYQQPPQGYGQPAPYPGMYPQQQPMAYGYQQPTTQPLSLFNGGVRYVG